MSFFHAEIAGIGVKYSFRNPFTALFFDGFQKNGPDTGAGDDGSFEHVAVTDKQFTAEKSAFPLNATPEHIEFKALIPVTSAALLSCAPVCIFHAAALTVFGKAWLIAAPSGVGKTTQLKNWRLMQDVPDAGVISGDMPVLERLSDGSVMVHPSPWNGKEGYRGAPAAPLGGIICLERADLCGENSIRLLEPSERIEKCLGQFVCLPETGEQTERLARLADAALCGYPVWLLRNRGDAESTALMIKTIEHYSAESSSGQGEAQGEAPRGGPGVPAASGCAIIQNATETLSEAAGAVRYSRREGVLLERICGEYLLMADAAARKTLPFISAVNEPSAMIWEFIATPRDLQECVGMLGEEYPDVDRERLAADASAFLSEMEKKGYVKAC